MSKITEALNWRYATKVFDSKKKVPEYIITELSEALRLSACSFGLQFWKFVIVCDGELKKELRKHSWNQSQVEDCSHLFILCSPLHVGNTQVDRYLDSICQVRSVERTEVEQFGDVMKGFIAKLDQHQKWKWMDNQIYLALGNLLTCCALKRIDSCPLEGFIPQKYDKVLGLKDKGLRSVVTCAVGYRSETDKYAALPKVRYPLHEVTLRY